MLKRFSERGLLLMFIAFEEAIKLDQGFIGAVHLLLAIVIEGTSSTAHTLKRFGINLEALYVQALKIPNQGITETYREEIPKVLQCAAKKAEEFGDETLCPIYFLLAMLELSQSTGAQLLRDININLVDLADAVVADYRQKMARKKASTTP